MANYTLTPTYVDFENNPEWKKIGTLGNIWNLIENNPDVFGEGAILLEWNIHSQQDHISMVDITVKSNYGEVIYQGIASCGSLYMFIGVGSPINSKNKEIKSAKNKVKPLLEKKEKSIFGSLDYSTNPNFKLIGKTGDLFATTVANNPDVFGENAIFLTYSGDIDGLFTDMSVDDNGKLKTIRCHNQNNEYYASILKEHEESQHEESQHEESQHEEFIDKEIKKLIDKEFDKKLEQSIGELVDELQHWQEPNKQNWTAPNNQVDAISNFPLSIE